MKICPECGKVLSYNSYFGAYICSSCNWEDASQGQNRNIEKKIFISYSSTKISKRKKPVIIK